MVQRNGRGWRPGNDNTEIEIKTYVTEGTFDAYLYQTLEKKQKFISQIMTNKNPVRRCEDLDAAALSYAEVKALCTGDPRIQEKMNLDTEVLKLNLLRASHLKQQYEMQDNLAIHYPAQISDTKERINFVQQDMEYLQQNSKKNQDGFYPIEILGKVYHDRETADKALLEVSKIAKGSPEHVGNYRGFRLYVHYSFNDRCPVLSIRNNLSYHNPMGTKESGNMVRLDNTLNKLNRYLEKYQDKLDSLHKNIELAKQEIEKLFPQEQELIEKTERLAELNALLSLDQKNEEKENNTPSNDMDKISPKDNLNISKPNQKEEKPSIIEFIRSEQAKVEGENKKLVSTLEK